MPPAPSVKPADTQDDVGMEGVPPGGGAATQADLFRWGGASMTAWRRDNYITTNQGYTGGYSMARKSRPALRNPTPWSTTNDTYGKSASRALSEQAGGKTSVQSFNSYRSVPGYRRAPGGAGSGLSISAADPVVARRALEERLRYGARPAPPALHNPPPALPATHNQNTHRNSMPNSLDSHMSSYVLPPMDPSKYLVAQGPTHPYWYKPEEQSTTNKMVIGETSGVPVKPPPPKTGAAKRYMRDSLDRFLRSIPEELRPRTRKRSVQPREEPQILKVVHRDLETGRAAALPDRNSRSVMSHAVPTPPSSAGSSRSLSASSASDDGVVDLFSSAYDLRKELEESKTGGDKNKQSAK